MLIKRGKPIDSRVLKRSLSKPDSIRTAGEFSRAIPPGPALAHCPICAHPEGRPIATVYNFTYCECGRCGVAYVANPPSGESLRQAYSSDYYTRATKTLYANPEISDYRVQNIAVPKVEFVLEHLTTAKRTWLDIGCGSGENLHVVAKKGFTALGLEANTMEREFAAAHFGLNVRDEYVTPQTLGNYRHKHGVVSLFSVLEHVPDPNSILANVAAIQEAGDNLVLEVPKYPSISVLSQVTFPQHVNRMLHPPLHLFLFPLRTIEMMLEKAGYRPLAVWMFGQDCYEALSTLAVLVPQLNDSPLYEALGPMVGDLQQVIDNHGLSDELLVVAQKVA
jgi:2-polyprenyl-3-methyl-5-hydroxy-6-metoxy-1,4-benzoquinol methylase